ncbi:MAG: phytanoyl-CoA dioxygenase family protein [Actinopolymorphaceae bacterium]
MADQVPLLTSKQLAQFVAAGFLRFDGVVDPPVGDAAAAELDSGRPLPKAGRPLDSVYPDGSPFQLMLRTPVVAGGIRSLVGSDAFAHNHDTHVRPPDHGRAQPLHADQIADLRLSRGTFSGFDVTLMYYPRDVTLEMGGTLVVPGSHLRQIQGADIGRYQNLRGQVPTVCPAGTVMLLHHGIWHCGRRNDGDQPRYMFRVRIHPTVPQVRLWDTSDLGDPEVAKILGQRFGWYELAPARHELISRTRLWRFLTGDPTYELGARTTQR